MDHEGRGDDPADPDGARRGRSGRRWWSVALLAAGVALLGAAAWSSLGRETALTAAPVGAVPVGAVPVGTVPVGAVPVGAVPSVTRAVESGDLRPGAPVRVRAPGTVPVGLELPGLAAPVVPVGTGPDGALIVPDPPQTVGWWAPGALAGSGTGTVVVAGHVDSRLAGVGVLAVLPQLRPGDPVVLRGADGRAVDYRVAARREFGKAVLPPDTFARTGAPRLVLITCGGRFDPVTRSYEDNIVVYAEPG